MPPIFAKLNLTTQKSMLVLNCPESFAAQLSQLDGITVFDDMKHATKASFALIFAMRQIDVDQFSTAIAAKIPGDAIIWFAYPKGTSKKLKCDFNRDNGWDVMRDLGFDTVRQVAIDEDWSALRFRRVEFIGSR